MALHIHTIFLMIISSMLLSSFLYTCDARDTITTGSSFSDINNDTLISAGERFQLGFFSPGHIPTNGKYIGMWYYMDPETVVWTANRDNPLSDPTGDFVIKEDGNLKVLDGNNKVYFTTNLDVSRGSNRTVKLLDSGNLVLIDHDQSGDTILWQSFDHPTDTFLPGMKMDEDLKLTSWTSGDDPRSGSFTFQQDQGGENRFLIIFPNGSTYWRNEDTGSFISSLEMFPAAAFLLSNFSSTADLSYQNKNNQTAYISYEKGKLVRARDFNNTRLLMNASGEIQFFSWSNETRWSLIWSEPRDNCSVYNACGNFGICNSKSVPFMCKCLPEFEPSSPDNWISGCTRMSTKCSKNSTFSNLKLMKVGKPNLLYGEVESENVCVDKCLENCQCQAYTYTEVYSTQRSRTRQRNSTRGCWIWISDLYSLWEDPEGDQNISVRIFISDTVGEPKRGEGSQNKRTIVVIFTIVIAVVLLISGINYISYRRRAMIR